MGQLLNKETTSLVVFDSFEEMENDQLQYFASLNPEELLANHKVLSLAAFGLTKDPGADAMFRKIKLGKAE